MIRRLSLTLSFWILALYVPFMGFRVLRSAGDEKVYVSQAYEMFERGSWFVQYFQGVPDFYKGPFHYWSVILGTHLFGHTMWATVYINLVLVLMTSLWLMREIHRRTQDLHRALTGGFAYASCLGVYFYSYASQMETEITCFVTFGFLSFLRTTRGRSSLWFWILAGAVGWVKSPLFCVFATISAVMGWAYEGSLLKRLRTPREWLHVAAGVVVCVVGYLPAALKTPEAFYQSYVLRESFNRPVLGEWHEAIVGLLFAFLMPWSFLLLGARVKTLFKPAIWSDEARYSLSFGLPIVLFFTFYLYRGQSYGMYTVGIVLFWMFTRLPEGVFPYQRWVALMPIVPLVLASLIQFYFRAPALWWSPLTFWVVLVLVVAGAVWTWRQGSAVPAMSAFLIGVNTLSAQLGEREVLAVNLHPATSFHYYALNQGIWSEWGYLNYAIRKKNTPIHNESQLTEFMLTGGTLLVPGEGAESELRGHLTRLGFYWDECMGKKHPWFRWKIRGADNQGKSYFGLALEHRDLDYLGRDYYIYDVRACRKYR